MPNDNNENGGEYESEVITDKEWERFFTTVDKIVNMPGATADEKKDLLDKKAEENASAGKWEEITCWYDGE